MLPYFEALFAVVIQNQTEAFTQYISEEEWHLMHELRKNGRGFDPGPNRQKPRSVFDLDLVPGEPIDFKELEMQWFEEQIRRQKKEP